MHDLYSSHSFEEQYTYTGCDLGAQWSPAKTVFRLWAPTAENVTVNLYRSGAQHLNDLLFQLTMRPDTHKGSFKRKKVVGEAYFLGKKNHCWHHCLLPVLN